MPTSGSKAYNVKKIDRDAYGITKNMSKVIVKCGDKTVESPEKKGLDGSWECDFEFTCEEDSVIKTQLVIDDKPIGDEASHELKGLGLIKGKRTYAKMLAPGGQVDFLIIAVDFGTEPEPEPEEEEGILGF